MTAADQSTDDSPRRTRLRAADRKVMILEAAGRAFAASGDVRGTTIKQIADEAGISEGIIYRHFESKEELFVQAAVEPLTAAVLASLDQIAKFDLDRVGPDLHELSVRYYIEAIDAIADLTPLLGLVLFGDPQYAVPFYRDVLAPALEQVRKSWDDAFRRETGEPYPSKVSASTHFGAILMLALERRLAERAPTTRSIAKQMVALEEHRLSAVLSGARNRLASPASTSSTSSTSASASASKSNPGPARSTTGKAARPSRSKPADPG